MLVNYLRSLSYTFRLRGPLREDPTAQVFNALLCALTAWWGSWSAILLPFHFADFFWSMPNLIVTFIGLVSALVLLRHGRLRAASIIYLASVWFFTTHAMAFNAGIRSPAQVLYVTLPISAAWLLGYEASVWVSAACMSCMLVFAVLELARVMLPHKIPGTPLGAGQFLGWHA